MEPKRPAPFTVDEKTLEPVENPSSKPSTQGSADRVIVTVKKDETPVQSTEAKPEETKFLFQNLFKNAGEGLFNCNANISSLFPPSANSPLINLNSPNLFNNNGPKPTPATTSLFGNLKTSTAPGDKPSGSLFGFSVTGVPPVRAGEDEESEKDSSDLEKEQELLIDKSKSKTKFDYKEEVTTLKNGIVKKYKRNNGDLIEDLEVLIQIKNEETEKKQEGEKKEEKVEEKVEPKERPKPIALIVVVRLPATKHPIFTGILVEGCEVRVINKKKENLEFLLVGVGQDKNPKKEKIKLQFDSSKTGEDFIAEIRKYLPTIIKEDKPDSKEETKQK